VAGTRRTNTALSLLGLSQAADVVGDTPIVVRTLIVYRTPPYIKDKNLGHIWNPSFKLKVDVNYKPTKFYTLIQKLLLG
jgi:hypothetical protein